MSSRGDATRTLIVETAERLFAEQGIESVSLRDISAAAGQRNHSAAQYHFGDRAGLVAAVFEHRMRLVNERRHALLDVVDPGDVRAVVDATVRPLAEVVAETGGWYGRFLVRTRWDAFARTVVADLPVLSSFERALDLLAAHLDGLDRVTRASRLDQLSTLFIGTIAGWEWRRAQAEPVRSVGDLVADLVSTGHAVLTAPAAVPTL